ncbi:site-specific integrase [Deinococcus detaillensis]|uniref:Site-specific integrase n=1 Tax=Deinococcus detaillensis TaxID=2592048 RepID=A0A553UHD3_9DEIO|nr:site-specific integrase [Deinococcus detaillensis]TSA79546.1 site-specific integrase [Deinococcus detaillensis]
MESEVFTLFDDRGQRLYLTPEERQVFKAQARAQDDRLARTFCLCLTYTGCRISEALELTPARIDWQEQAIIFRTLKKRGRKKETTYRTVPVPLEYIDELNLIHHLTGKGHLSPTALLWPWSRMTAWRRVKGVMELAGIQGIQATPKGLRHGFGVAHALQKTPLPILQRWMGHSTPTTTAIYMQALGDEARQLAKAVW